MEPIDPKTIKNTRIMWVGFLVASLQFIFLARANGNPSNFESVYRELVNDPSGKLYLILATVQILLGIFIPRFLVTFGKKAGGNTQQCIYLGFIVRLAFAESITLYGF